MKPLSAMKRFVPAISTTTTGFAHRLGTSALPLTRASPSGENVTGSDLKTGVVSELLPQNSAA